MVHPSFDDRHFFQTAQNGRSARPQAMQKPQAYPLGYVEDCCEPRTKLTALFSSL